MTLAVDAANDALDAAIGTCDTARLHTGDPGPAGTSNVLGTGDDAAITFGAAGAVVDAEAHTGAVTWTGISAAGSVTDVSLWDGAVFRSTAQLPAPRAVTLGGELPLANIVQAIV